MQGFHKLACSPTKSSQSQQLGNLRCGCPHSPVTLLCCPNFCHLHILWEPGSVPQDLVFDEKFCPLFGCLHLTPQTQRLNITVQNISINHCRYRVTEGNAKSPRGSWAFICHHNPFFLPKIKHLSSCQTGVNPWYP